jgi:hypothetical protein
MRELSTMVELTGTELDAVAAGGGGHGNPDQGNNQIGLVNVGANVDIEDVDVNVQALNGIAINAPE